VPKYSTDDDDKLKAVLNWPSYCHNIIFSSSSAISDVACTQMEAVWLIRLGYRAWIPDIKATAQRWPAISATMANGPHKTSPQYSVTQAPDQGTSLTTNPRRRLSSTARRSVGKTLTMWRVLTAPSTDSTYPPNICLPNQVRLLSYNHFTALQYAVALFRMKFIIW